MDQADIDELLTREYRVALQPGARYVVAELPLAEGAPLEKGSTTVKFEVIRERKNGSQTTEEIVRQAHTFESGTEGVMTLQRYRLDIGQDVPPGDVLVAECRVAHTFANLIELIVRAAVKTLSDLHMAPAIPEKKLKNAIDAYAKTVDAERVLFLYDDTVFGSAKEGFLITDSGFYYKSILNELSFRFNDVASHRIEDRKVGSGDKAVPTPHLVLQLQDGTEKVFVEGWPALSAAGLGAVLAVIETVRADGLTKDVDGYVIVEDMPAPVKLAYMNSLVWMTYHDDGEIDERELSELQVLMTQVRCDVELRQAVRGSIGEPQDLDLEALIRDMQDHTPSGSERALAGSLIKDAVRLHRAASQGPALERASIRTLATLLEIDDAQIAFIEEACIQDEKILAGEISDDQIKTIAKEMASKASAVGVPVAAVYLSGSVTGLSAAGVTSGLSALGLGGVLGLSSMVTGIGVAIVLGVGVGVYKGMQWLMGGAERDKASRRELMLQEVLRIHQKAIANLAEDISHFGKTLVALTGDVERNRRLIAKLSREMTMFASALAQLRLRESGFELDLESETQKRAA